MDQTTRDKITRDNAYHQAALARRAEAFEQEIEHRRLMLGLERFHEFEIANIRKQAATRPGSASNITSKPAFRPREATGSASWPRGTLFKQVAEDGGEVVEPLCLRVVWVDSDRGGLFRWASATTEVTGEDETNEQDAPSEMRESKSA